MAPTTAPSARYGANGIVALRAAIPWRANKNTAARQPTTRAQITAVITAEPEHSPRNPASLASPIPIESGLNQEMAANGRDAANAQRNRPGRRSGEKVATATKTGSEPKINARLGIRRSRRSVTQTQARVAKQEIPTIREVQGSSATTVYRWSTLKTSPPGPRELHQLSA